MDELRITSADAQLIVSAFERELKSLATVIKEGAMPQCAYDRSEAAPLTVVLNLRGLVGRTALEIWVKSSGPANFEVAGSRNGVDFRHLHTLSITSPAGGERHEGFMNAYPVIRVSTNAANNNEIEIVAAG